MVSPAHRQTSSPYAIYSTVLRETLLAEGWAGHPENPPSLRRPIERPLIQAESDPEAPTALSDYAGTHPPSLEQATAADFESQPGGVRLERRFEGTGSRSTSARHSSA